MNLQKTQNFNFIIISMKAFLGTVEHHYIIYHKDFPETVSKKPSKLKSKAFVYASPMGTKLIAYGTTIGENMDFGPKLETSHSRFNILVSN